MVGDTPRRTNKVGDLHLRNVLLQLATEGIPLTVDMTTEIDQSILLTNMETYLKDLSESYDDTTQSITTQELYSYVGPTLAYNNNLTNTPIELTISSFGYNEISLYIKLTGSALDSLQIKSFAGYDNTDVNYAFPLEIVSATQIIISKETILLPTVDSIDKYVLRVKLNRSIPYVKLTFNMLNVTDSRVAEIRYLITE